MRKTVVASLSLPPALADESRRVAQELGKTRSQLFVEAIESYLRLHRFRKLQGRLKAKASGRVRGEGDVERMVREYRRSKR